MASYQAPFDHLGNLLHYPAGVAEWRKITPFTATLVFEGFQRGRSAAYALFVDSEGHRYPMFLSHLEEILLNGTIKSGTPLESHWIVKKRGQNYGIARAGQ